jgi:transcriptional regulator with XRE-family HTH domain
MNPLRRNRIKELRALTGLSQEQLGEYLTVGRTQISKWERGLQTFSNEQAWQMASIFHCRPGDLFEKPKEKPGRPPRDLRLEQVIKAWPVLDETARAAIFRLNQAMHRESS